MTSIEWCPFESSMLSTTSAEGQLALWDLALERDPEEEAALAAHMNAATPDDLPAQLLFVHLQQVRACACFLAAVADPIRCVYAGIITVQVRPAAAAAGTLEEGMLVVECLHDQ